MSQSPDPPSPPAERHTSEILANERTFLAWIRTSVAVISLGFVIARFSFWLNELVLTTGRSLPFRRTGLSLPIGLGMMGFGALLTILSALRYRAMNHAIARGEMVGNNWLVTLVTVLTVVLAVVLIAYLLIASNQL